jgi:hypothetical protein
MTIDVRGRRIERLLGVVALIAAAVASALLFAPLQAAVLSAGAVVVVLGGLWRQGWLGGERRLRSLSWLPDGRWLLADARHPDMPADLLAGSRVGSRWLWLRWSASCSQRPHRRSMLLVHGDIPAADLRRLTVRLRLQSQVPGSHAASRHRQVCAQIPGA